MKPRFELGNKQSINQIYIYIYTHTYNMRDFKPFLDIFE